MVYGSNIICPGIIQYYFIIIVVAGRDLSLHPFYILTVHFRTVFLFHFIPNSVNLPFAIVLNMNLKERIESFSALGNILRNGLADRSAPYGEKLNDLIDSQYLHNPWFTPENVKTAVKNIAHELTEENLITEY